MSTAHIDDQIVVAAEKACFSRLRSLLDMCVRQLRGEVLKITREAPRNPERSPRTASH
ncbi:MAG TPA: hypothetical protein VGA84_07075 [Thermoanaerobaculia bacterium]